MARSAWFLSLLLLALLAAACSSSSSGTGGGEDPDVVAGLDLRLPIDVPGSPDLLADGKGFDTGAPDLGSPDTGQEDSGGPPLGGFESPCSENRDCLSGYCVEGPDGFICTQTCLTDCPEGYLCRAIGQTYPDPVFICLPEFSPYCQPCQDDRQCPAARCVALEDGTFCLNACGNEGACPEGYHCESVAMAGGDEEICIPDTGICSCRAETDGQIRPCEISNELGTCRGFESCEAASGWSGCSAGQPVEEICNGQDDDCDGQVDEDFRVEGLYATDEHCGYCNVNCGQGFPNGTAACSTDYDPPRCVVVQCAPGFVQLNEFQCVPNFSSVCQPCDDAAACLPEGSACTQLNDGTYCASPCESDGNCLAGYVCTAVAEEAEGTYCVPETGSCGCDGSNLDLQRVCTVTRSDPANPGSPSYTCTGVDQCTADGWSGCVMPDEICDGQDNDCDGLTDEGFFNVALGVYDSPEHCGACGNSCAALCDLPEKHCQGACDTSGPVPVCTIACDTEGGWFDVNENPVDGCECQYSAVEDRPDGVDQNCDGVDGDITRAVFVAKDGDDDNPGTLESPMLSIGAAIARAAADEALVDVYVATGVYAESVVLVPGVSLWGGFSSTFRVRDAVLYETVIFGQPASPEAPGAVTALGLQGAETTTLAGFSIYGADNDDAGESSYAIYVRDCDESLHVRGNRVHAGDGGDGARGADGVSGTSGASGAVGTNAQDGGSCSRGSTFAQGGAGGGNSCAALSVAGGRGGNAQCPDFDEGPDFEEYGVDGSGPAGGDGGASGHDAIIRWTSGCSTCVTPPNNQPRYGAPGLPGSAGSQGAAGAGCADVDGDVAGGFWAPAFAGQGADGGHGSGGGGGGAGGGVELSGCSGQGGSDIGGTGGGGGAGGCGGLSGSGGGGGGGSFGIFLVFSAPPAALPVFEDNAVWTGRGGSGGDGGNGGTGGTGGAGGAGGVDGAEFEDYWCAAGGGEGGDGGNAGHGGGGGGGCGGPSYGFFAAGQGGADLSALLSENAVVIQGQGGRGGRGGNSLGNPGQAGTDGAAAAASF